MVQFHLFDVIFRRLLQWVRTSVQPIQDRSTSASVLGWMNPRGNHISFASVPVMSNRRSARKCSVAPCNIFSFSKFLSFTSPSQSWLKSFVAVILALDRPIWSSRHLSNRRSSFARALRSCLNISLFASLFCSTLSSCYLVILLSCYLVTSSVMQSRYLACLSSSSSLLPGFRLWMPVVRVYVPSWS